jgi:D-glycero-D-manno-heptose 1,7-bisphosphate phosphatase
MKQYFDAAVREKNHRPAIFIDRDGVINANRADYVKSWAEFEFLPGSREALVGLSGLGWPVVVISNQSAIGRGLVSAATVAEINARMVAEIEQAGGRVDGVYICPHHPDEGCACRKPQPGLLMDAALELGLDLGCSYVIGDAESDILAGLAVGAQPILVLSGRGREQRPRLAGWEGMFQVVEDLTEAVEWIVSREL